MPLCHRLPPRCRRLPLACRRSPPHLPHTHPPCACRACVILSGGLDSSIAACAGNDILGLSAAFTVLCSPAATDRQYAAQVAAALPGLEHHVIDISLEEALEELPDCVRVLQSFDPMMLRNDIAGGWAGSGAAMWAGSYGALPAVVRIQA